MTSDQELKALLAQCRNSVKLDMEAHQRLAGCQAIGPTTRGIHEAEAQRLNDTLLRIDEELEAP